MTDSRTPSELVTEAMADLVQAVDDLHVDLYHDATDPKVWDAAADLAQGAAGLLSEAARRKRETPGDGQEGRYEMDHSAFASIGRNRTLVGRSHGTVPKGRSSLDTMAP